MDDARFDALARSLRANHSRRRLARLLSGAALGGTLALRNLPDAPAKRKKRKKKRRDRCPTGTVCGKECVTCPVGERVRPESCACCLEVGAPCVPLQSCSRCCSGESAEEQCTCKGPGQPCAANIQCCSERCEDNACCNLAGDFCFDDVDCCGALFCVGGDPGLGTCVSAQ